MKRQPLTGQPHYDELPIGTYGASGSRANQPVRSSYAQYSPLGWQKSYLPSQTPKRLPPRPGKAFRYDCDHPIFAGHWGLNDNIALATFNESCTNFLYVLQADSAQSPSRSLSAEARLNMPPTKAAWNPQGENSLLTSGDALRLWQFDPVTKALKMSASLAKHAKSERVSAPAPMTSFDWNVVDPNTAIVSSADTTCTVWDLTTQTVRTQLIAHDQEVYDAAFLKQSQFQFVSVGCDGSARLFDLRALENSTIIYESPNAAPMLRIAPSPHDSNVIAAFGQDQKSVVVLDIRATRNPVKLLEGHQAPLNSIIWLPNRPGFMATGGDDCQLLLWDVRRGCVAGSHNEIQQVNMVLASPDSNWLGSVNGKSLQCVSTQLS